MTTMYKLVLILRVPLSSRRFFTWDIVFIWNNREDALACKALLEKCLTPKHVRIHFVEFTEEVPL